MFMVFWRLQRMIEPKSWYQVFKIVYMASKKNHLVHLEVQGVHVIQIERNEEIDHVIGIDHGIDLAAGNLKTFKVLFWFNFSEIVTRSEVDIEVEAANVVARIMMIVDESSLDMNERAG